MKSSNVAVIHTSVFREPDALAQFEFGREYGGKPQNSPEKRLMFAILIDAVECFQRYQFAAKTRDRRLFQQAEVWIFGDERKWIYCFENICQELQIDPDYLRSGLRRWRDRCGPSDETARTRSAFRPPQQRLRNSNIYV